MVNRVEDLGSIVKLLQEDITSFKITVITRLLFCLCMNNALHLDPLHNYIDGHMIFTCGERCMDKLQRKCNPFVFAKGPRFLLFCFTSCLSIIYIMFKSIAIIQANLLIGIPQPQCLAVHGRSFLFINRGQYRYYDNYIVVTAWRAYHI